MNLRKIVHRVMGDKRAEELVSKLRRGTVKPEEVHEEMVAELLNMPELMVFDERPGGR